MMKDPPLPSGTMDDAKLIPEVTASWFSLLTFDWITPMLNLGYARPLEVTDLWRLQDSRSAEVYADRILEAFERRHKAAEEYNARLAGGEVHPGWRKKFWWRLRGDTKKKENAWREKDGKRKASLTMAMNDAVKWYFWIGGLHAVLAVYGDRS